MELTTVQKEKHVTIWADCDWKLFRVVRPGRNLEQSEQLLDAHVEHDANLQDRNRILK